MAPVPGLLMVLAFALLAHTQVLRKFTPATIPLAVRTPYLNCWINCPNCDTLGNVWPQYWTNQFVSLLNLRTELYFLNQLLDPGMDRPR